jgi:hypothetical protein
MVPDELWQAHEHLRQVLRYLNDAADLGLPGEIGLRINQHREQVHNTMELTYTSLNAALHHKS